MRTGAWTADDIPDLTGRTAVVTGGNAGLGLEVARGLAGRGAAVVLAVRDPARGAEAAADIRTTAPGAQLAVVSLDLASLASVRAAADAIREPAPGIDVLVNNAGVMGGARATTADGFERRLGVNHLGHFALTGLLLERLLAVDGSRVVTVSSVLHWFGRHPGGAADCGVAGGMRGGVAGGMRGGVAGGMKGGVGGGVERWIDRRTRYARSKLANLIFTYELERRLVAAGGVGVRTAALAAHPGWTNTGILRHSSPVLRAAQWVGRPLGQRPEQGALPVLRAATDPDAVGGSYFGPGGPLELRGAPRLVPSSRHARDPAAGRRLWEESEAATGVVYPI